MDSEQKTYTPNKGWNTNKEFRMPQQPQIVFVFGSSKLITNSVRIEEIKNYYPSAKLIGCSTAGEIGNDFIENESLIVSAIYFEKTTIISTK